MSTALNTDRYELTMLDSVLHSGTADTPAVFEVFARRLPPGRRFGLLAGTGRLLDALTDFTFDEPELAWLRQNGVISDAARDYLTGWHFTGDIDGYQEGQTYWPHSPVLTVRARLADAFLIETITLSILNHDTAVASAAARMVLAAAGRPLIEMGSRRVDPEAAVAAARAAYIAGFASTSNLAAGRRYGVPTTGTAAHAYILAHANEQDAFEAQMRAHGTDTTVLVDTYDQASGIERAVAAARSLGASGPGAIRIDSGDLLTACQAARAQLDALGATSTRIVLTSEIDEYTLTELDAAPANAYGAGTKVVTGSGHPSAGFVYKLVQIDGRPVAKTAPGKTSTGGAKTPYRIADAEHYSLDGTIPTGAVPMSHPLMRSGRSVPDAREPLTVTRERAQRTLAGLDASATAVADGAPATICTKEQP